MGTFIGCIGDSKIFEDKREAVMQDVKKLLEAGGMMSLEKVKIFDREICLLASIHEKTSDGFSQGEKLVYILPDYNFFDEDSFPDMGLEATKLRFFSDKVGWRRINSIASAFHMLESLYSSDVIPDLRESNRYPDDIIAWINSVLGKEELGLIYYDWWEAYERIRKISKKMCQVHTYAHEIDPDFRDMRRFYRSGDLTDLDGILSYFTVKFGFDNALTELFKRVRMSDAFKERYIRLYALCHETFDSILSKHTDLDEAAIKDTAMYVINSAKVDLNLGDDKEDVVKMLIVFRSLPLPVIVKFFAERLNIDFWEFWDSDVDKDEWNKRKIVDIPTESDTLSTCEYLNIEPKNMFMWLEEDEVEDIAVLVEEFRQWGKELEELEKDTELPSSDKAIESIVITLADLATSYRNERGYGIYMFKETFYDMIAHSSDRRWMAAFELLKKLSNDNKERFLEESKGENVFDPKEFCEPKWMIIRYLMLLNYPSLRKKYLDF
ncbi:MAG: hypothetical protein LUG83_03865 [Lachnospiraceae bacterium]|nr:hypothetical protein [Lachnospiraceae bacterium]